MRVLASLALLAPLALACASTGAARLDGLYPPGEPRANAAGSGPRREVTLARTQVVEAGAALTPDARAALGPDRSGRVAGYDAYDVRQKVGGGYNVRWKSYCDTVFFDASDRIVGATRREGRC